ncbi:MAG TPA: hypothetical protein VFD71_21715 [Planctomycetota bacterium]|nr:hypothetical protein [Planctomycetota bacterium]
MLEKRSRAWLPMVLLGFVAGCAGAPRQIEPPERKDDFGDTLETQPITAETVSETQMLHRRWQLELKGQASIPTGFFAANDFDAGPSAGAKVSIETAKNLFVGVDFDWAQWKQNNGVGDALANPTDLENAKPDQLYDKVDRYEVLLAIDYDWTIAKSFIGERSPLIWRFGLGLGGGVFRGDVDPALKQQTQAAGSDIEIVPLVAFVGRLGTGLRFQLAEHVILFTEASYDFVAPFNIEVRINRERSQVDGDIDFGAINLGAGIAFEF